MKIYEQFVKSCIMVLLVATVAPVLVYAQTAVEGTWAPPNNIPPTGGARSVIDLSTTNQIKVSPLVIDLSNTASTILGPGLYLRAGAFMVEYMGSGSKTTWAADTVSAILSNGRLRANGVYSSAGAQSNVLKQSGQTGEKVVCVDLATGKLKLCGVLLGPPIDLFAVDPLTIPSEQDVTIEWNSPNADGCVGTNFSTGTGDPNSGTVSLSVAVTTTFTVTCIDSLGQTNSASATVTVGSSNPVVNISAAPTTISSGQGTTVTWSATNAVSCNQIPPSPIAFNTAGLVAGSQNVTLYAPGMSPVVYEFKIRCTSSSGGTTDGSTFVTVNP